MSIYDEDPGYGPYYEPVDDYFDEANEEPSEEVDEEVDEDSNTADELLEPAEPVTRSWPADVAPWEILVLRRIRRNLGLVERCPICGHVVRRTRGGDWVCEACLHTFPADSHGAPAAPRDCPFCSESRGLVLRSGQGGGRIWRCTACGGELADGAAMPLACPECHAPAGLVREGGDHLRCRACGFHVPVCEGLPLVSPSVIGEGRCAACGGRTRKLEPPHLAPSFWFCCQCGSTAGPREEDSRRHTSA